MLPISRIGPATAWYPNGRIERRTSSRAGKRHGEVETWFASGNRKWAGMYDQGEKNETFVVWRQTVKKRQETNYKWGAPNGCWVGLEFFSPEHPYLNWIECRLTYSIYARAGEGIAPHRPPPAPSNFRLRHNEFSPLSLRSSGRRDSNPRHQPWQGCTLPTELRPRLSEIISSPPLLRNPFPQPPTPQFLSFDPRDLHRFRELALPSFPLFPEPPRWLVAQFPAGCNPH